MQRPLLCPAHLLLYLWVRCLLLAFQNQPQHLLNHHYRLTHLNQQVR